MTIHIPAWVDGALTPVEKLDVHKRGLRHKAVSVFVVRGNELLIQQRAMSKYHTPGLLANTCCTHPEWNEDPAACAVRRLQEELGIVGLEPDFRDQIEYRADVGNGLIEHEVVDVYLAQADSSLLLDPSPYEVMNTRWIGLDDLRSDLQGSADKYTPWLKIYMDQHSTQILGDQVTA